MKMIVYLVKLKYMASGGIEHADFIMNDIKAFVDNNYRALADQQHTAIIRSSLGISLCSFIAIKYVTFVDAVSLFSLANLNSLEVLRAI